MRQKSCLNEYVRIYFSYLCKCIDMNTVSEKKKQKKTEKTKYKILCCKFACAFHKFYSNNNWAKDYLNIALLYIKIV